MIKAEDRQLQILDTINENPGINFCDIMRMTGLKNGVLSYYVRKLEHRKKVLVKRKTGNTRFFPLQISEQESILLEMLRRPTPREIILLIWYNSDGLTLNQIIKKLGKAQSTISVHIQILISNGIIQVKFISRKKIYQIKKPTVLEHVIKHHASSFLTENIQNFREIINSL